MVWQSLVTALLVAACAVYALWSLLPRSLRQRVAAWRGKPLPPAGACGGCDGCGSSPKAEPPKEAVIRIVRRPPGGP
jgi:ferrous iron transport protein B